MSSPSRPSSPSDDPTTALLTYLTTSTTLVDDLHNSLLSSLHRSGWAERIRDLSYELLREGYCDRFDEMMEVVCELVGGNKKGLTPAVWKGVKRKRKMEEEEEEETDGEGEGGRGAHSNGVSKDEEEKKKEDLPDKFVTFDVTLPEAVVGDGVRQIKKVMHEAFEFESEDKDKDEEDENEGGNDNDDDDDGDDDNDDDYVDAGPGDDKDADGDGEADEDGGDADADADGDADADADADGDAESEFNPTLPTINIDEPMSAGANTNPSADPNDEFADLLADTENMFDLDSTTGYEGSASQSLMPDIPGGDIDSSTKQTSPTGKKWKSKSGPKK